MRLNRQNPRYYAFDNGDFYFPIGPNLGWATQSGLGVLKDYERWLDRLSQNGGNVGRVWMASWSFAIEWNDTGLGDYSGRMQQAWLLDQVFKLAEQRGVYLMLTLLNHGAFSDSVNPEWDSNPYNAANGGPLKTPREFGRNKRGQGDLQAAPALYRRALGLFTKPVRLGVVERGQLDADRRYRAQVVDRRDGRAAQAVRPLQAPGEQQLRSA